MAAHKDRAEEREKKEEPKNFTCGKCGRVHPYNKELKCTEEEEEDEEA